MEVDEPDPMFWVYLALLITFALLTLLLTFISCTVICDILKQKQVATCLLSKMAAPPAPPPDVGIDDISSAYKDSMNYYDVGDYYDYGDVYAAKIRQKDPKRLKAMYFNIINEYLKRKKLNR